MGHRKTLSGALDVGTSRLARVVAADAGRSAFVDHHAAAITASHPPRTGRGPRRAAAKTGRSAATPTTATAPLADIGDYTVYAQHGAGGRAGLAAIALNSRVISGPAPWAPPFHRQTRTTAGSVARPAT